MTKINDQRSIVDRRALVARLAALDDGDLPKHKRRIRVLEVFKEALASGRAEVRRRFDDKGDGTEVVRQNCFLIDQLVRTVHDYATEHEFAQGVRTSGEAMSLVAVGGYGRGELSPQSDIDLLFLLPYKRTPWHEQLVEYILYMLWDMGLTVGHSTRTAEECIKHARADYTIRTALLEARWLWGDQELFFDLQNRFRNEVMAGTAEEFVESKLAERHARIKQMGDSRYVLEPNCKEGKGGLRDLHTLYWIAKYMYRVKDVPEMVEMGVISRDAATRFAKAQAFLWTVRCHLHYVTGRAEERLTFDVQQEIARRMGYADRAGSRGVERFMKHYFLIAKDVGDLVRLFCAIAEEQHKRKPRLQLGRLWFKRANISGFRLDGGRLSVTSDDQFEKDPVAMIRLFHTALEHDADIHPKAADLVHRNLKRIDARTRNDAEANRLFVAMLTSKKNPEVALRHMNEAGVLGRFIPDFGRVVAQMQYDMYHVYTVDEHTIQAIGILHSVEQGELKTEAPVASEIIHKVESRRALYVSVFLHDIAKGRNGDHSELGAEVAQKLGPRLGLTDAEVETAAWCVRHHLLMSRIAFKRDIDDPKTIHDFAALVQSPERLRQLLLLTVADIRAVGPTVWNAWKAGLLRELYLRAEEVMTGGLTIAHARDARVKDAQLKLTAELLRTGWLEAEVEAHLARGYPTYWTSFETATHQRHARLVREAEATGAPLTVDSRVDCQRAVTEITVYTGDHPGLFSQIAGAMAVSGANIVDAKIITLANGMALDSFCIQDSEGGAFESPAKLAKLAATVEQVLSGRMWLDRELAARKGKLPSRAHVFRVPPRVIVDNKASTTHTVLEVNGRDRPGLLYDLTSAMTGLGLQITSAHISTYGERVVDVFYVKDVFGLKVEHERKLAAVKDALFRALEDPAAAKAAE